MRTRRAPSRFSQVALVVLLAGLVVAAFAAAMLVVSGAHLGVVAILGLAYGGVVIAASGQILVLWALEGTSSKIALAILVGSVATSCFLTGGCLLSGRSASTVFLWWSVLVAAVAFQSLRASSTFKSVNTERPFRFGRQVDLWDLASTLATGLTVAIWCRRAAALLPTLHATGVAPIWSDYFIHGTEIAQFGDPLAVGRSSFLLVGQPIVFYHYASYMLPAAVAGLVDLPAFGLATSLLLPYGIFLAALGCSVFVKTTASGWIALLAPMALFLLPDASNIGFRNGFFGFHWLLFTVPGSGYGLGVAFAALTIASIWRADRRKETLWLGLFMTAALFEFRAHIFLLFAPALAMTMLWETEAVQRHTRPILAVVVCVAVIAAACVAVVPIIRQAWLHVSVFDRFMETVHTGMPPTAYDGIYQMVEQRYGRPAAWLLGFWALIPIALGALTLAMPVAMTIAIRRTGWQRLDSFPIWCIATWLGVVLLAPGAHGDPTEYQHRPFVLVYAAVFVWTIMWANRAMHATRSARFRSPAVFLFPTLLVAAIGASVATTVNQDPARPQFAWGSQFFGTRLQRGLLEAARFVRTQAAVGDTFVLIPADPLGRLDDAATRFAALSNVPAYVARAGIQVLNGQGRRAVVEQRLTTLKMIETADDSETVTQALRAVGVRFLVALGDRGPRFDPDGSHAAFRAGGAAVYANLTGR
jgi:hypothetical protein